MVVVHGSRKGTGAILLDSAVGSARNLRHFSVGQCNDLSKYVWAGLFFYLNRQGCYPEKGPTGKNNSC